MARTYSPEAAGLATAGRFVANNAEQLKGNTVHVIATITMASQASGDDIVLGEVEPGWRFLGATVNPSATTGTATIALGLDGNTAKYAAAVAYTSTDTPTAKGKATAIGVAETARKKILATVGTAALPASGTLSIVLRYGIGG